MKKEIQKPFDIEAIRNGAHAKTNLGEEMEFVGECSNDEYPFVFYHNGLVDTYDLNGRYNHDYDNRDEDIIIVEEVEEPESWAENEKAYGKGWYVDSFSKIQQSQSHLNKEENYNVFATEKQAKSALAMARISQLMAHDKRYGGVVTDEDWEKGIRKYGINRQEKSIVVEAYFSSYHFLVFHTEKQAQLFLAENERLVKDYLMID